MARPRSSRLHPVDPARRIAPPANPATEARLPASDDLVWLAEDACRNAWPSPRQVLLGGFLLRAAGGPTRRTNSLNPLRDRAPGSRYDVSPVIEACERIYAAQGRHAIARVPAIAPGMDASLERRGYTAYAECCTLFADLTGLAGLGGAPDPDVSLSGAPGEDWLEARSRLNRADAEADRVYRAMTEAIVLPKVFAALRVDGAVAAMAYAALQPPLVVIESVGTLEAARGRGHARRILTALMRWGGERGATGACLQVMAENRPARALYEALGFRELFRYHYRRRDAVG